MRTYDQIVNGLIETRKKRKTYDDIVEETIGKNKRSTDAAPVDVAPVEERKGNWLSNFTAEYKGKSSQGNGYFQKGALEDGDVGKAIKGTTMDATEDVSAGAIGIWEKLLDGLTKIAAANSRTAMMNAANDAVVHSALTGGKTEGIVDKYLDMQEDVENQAVEMVKKDLYDEHEVAKTILAMGNEERRKYIDTQMENDSVLAQKSDALANTTGEWAMQQALNAIGMPWWATTAVSSMGGESENALNAGASYGEAGVSGMISAGGEVLSELAFGGMFGETGLDDVFIEDFSKISANKFYRGLVKWGFKSGGEGFEEVFSDGISKLGQWLTYQDEKTFKEMFASEEAIEGYIDSFIGGLFLGGVSNAAQGIKTTVQGGDYASNLTKNENLVADKVYKDAVKEAETDGKKLTAREKAKLYDTVLNDMKKGYISTDTIEEVLGGETYKSYKDTVDNETALQKEFDTLNKMKQGEMTGEQLDRRAELKQQLEELKNTTTKSDLKTKLGDEVFSLVKDSKLAESYNQRTKRGQAFTADLSQYDTKYHDTIKKAVDSGILNDTRRTHEFVDLIAKVSADKGVLFDFTNNEKIANSIFAVEGKTTNGYVDADGNIAINIDSAKALESTVGHEITHILEGTELYTALETTITEHAISKGDYQSRLETLTRLYEGVEGADVNKELVADLVGDYLFTDTDFVRKLSTENQNIFQKIYDEIKYLCKVATAGSKEARQLEKVKKAFEDAYRENGNAKKNTAENSGKKYSISETTDGRIVAVVDSDILNKIDTTSWDKTKKETAKKAASNALKQFSDGIVVDGITRKVNRTSRREYTRSNDTEKLYKNVPGVFADKMRAAAIADDIVVATTNWNRDGGLQHSRDDTFVDFDHGTTLISSGNAKYIAEVVVGITKSGGAVFYDVVDMTPTTFDIKKAEISTTATTQNAIGDINEISATESVPQNPEHVKAKYSLSAETDNTYLKAVENGDTETVSKMVEQAAEKAMPNSKVRDDNGNLRLVYHGRVSDFNVFDRSFGNSEGDFGRGFYFTSNEYDVDANYANEEGPDLKNKIERYAEQLEYQDEYADLSYEERKEIAREHYITSEPNTVTAYLNMQNPVYITTNEKGTFLDFDEQYDEEYDEYGKPEGLLVDFIEALENNASGYATFGDVSFDFLYEDAFDNGGVYANDAVQKIKNRIFDELTEENGDLAVNEVIRQSFEDIGFDGIIDTSVSHKFRNIDGMDSGTTHYIVFNSNQIKEADLTTYDDNGNVIPLSERFNTQSDDIRYSISEQGAKVKKQPNLTYGEDVKLDIAPTVEDIAPTENVEDNSPVFDAPITEEQANAMAAESLESLTDADAPIEVDEEYYNIPDTSSIDNKTLKNIGKSLRDTLSLTPQETKAIQEIVQEYSTSELPSNDELFDTIKEKFSEKVWKEKNNEIADVKRWLRNEKINVSQKIKQGIDGYSEFRKSHSGKIAFSKEGIPVDSAYMELSELYPNFFPADIVNEADQLLRMGEVADMEIYTENKYTLDDETIQEAVNIISNEVRGYKDDLARTAAEETARADLHSVAPPKAEQLTQGLTSDANLNNSLDNQPIKTVKDRLTEKLRAVESELADNKQLRREAFEDYNAEIERLSEEYSALKDKNTKKANNIVQRVTRLERLKATVDADFAKRISDLEARVEKMNSATYQTAVQRKSKMQEYAEQMENLVGDTSTWKDKKIGLQYEVNTLHRNLRYVVRDENGNRDIAKADAIYEELQGKYNQHEAELKRESARIKKVFADMKITNAESAYIQMLGELRSNPQTTLTEDAVKEFYQKHKNKIDTAKVDKAINLAHQTFDSLLERVNATLREQGMKEIPYRQGYFPHFVEPKQNFVQKLLNWKTQNNEIPTDIAGLTEEFNPERSWQSFNKERQGDTTDYNFTKGLDNYVQGALDWIYHIEDIQKRRAFENHIRYVHSEKGIQERIDAIRNNEEYDADEAQAQIDLVLNEAKNPLNNFVVDFRTGTNVLAGKKNSLDRVTEQQTGREIYSIMTNIQNRTSANLVLANVRSALTNFIPITQSWAQVSPIRSLQATKDTIANAIKNDGMVEKSTFLTNRLRNPDNLYQTNWDKVLDKAGIMFEVIDNFSAQVIWRSKYNQNIAKGMSESRAIKNADQFAENVMAGRSRGNEPTLFTAKSPIAKVFTIFQLEVNNQYGYLFKDVPQDLKAETKHWKLNLIKGLTTAFVGAYVYNALLEQAAGSGAALDPIGIIEDLLRDLGLFDDDEEKEPTETAINLVDNIAEELPFVGGLFGGGRIPISSALPYEDDGIKGFIQDANDVFLSGDKETAIKAAKNFGKEMMNPVLNIGLPVGGGQIKKTMQGLSMFNTDEDHPIAGSYTDSGGLRFPVDDTLKNRIQAGIFGQWANENARDYIENGRKPLNKKQTQEFVDVDLPIGDYWDYREGLSGLKTLKEKAEYINSLDIEDWQKNLLINNIADRKEDIDMSNYDDYGSFEEFDYAEKNPKKYEFFKSNGISYEDYANADEDGKAAYSWAYNNPEKYTLSKAVADDVVTYRQYTSDLYDIKADKDENGDTIVGSSKEKKLAYINSLDELDYGQKIILYRSLFNSKQDRADYNAAIVNYLNEREDISYEDMVTILEELDMTVDEDGNVYWD